MGGYASTTSDVNSKKCIEIMSEFEAVSVSRLQSSRYPQLVVGRISGFNEILESPLTGSKCVYYSTVVNGRTFDTESQDYFRFREEIVLDFCLSDSNLPNQRLYVNVDFRDPKSIPVKLAIIGETMRSHYEVMKDPEYRRIRQLAERQHFQLNESKLFGSGMQAKNLDFIEKRLNENDQIAILGIVEDSMDSTGKTRYTIKPIDKSSVQNMNVSSTTKKYLHDLTFQGKHLLISNHPKLFKNINLYPLALTSIPAYSYIIPSDNEHQTKQQASCPPSQCVKSPYLDIDTDIPIAIAVPIDPNA